MPLAYRVNPCRYSRARIDGVWTAASNDLGVASSEFLVDEAFLSGLPSIGQLSNALVPPSRDEQHGGLRASARLLLVAAQEGHVWTQARPRLPCFRITRASFCQAHVEAARW